MCLLTIVAWIVMHYYLQYEQRKWAWAYVGTTNPYGDDAYMGADMWETCKWSVAALWIAAFPVRYIYFMTKWAIKTMKQSSQN